MRWWNDFVAYTADVLAIPWQILISLLLALVVALLWYFYPYNWQTRGSDRERRRRDRRDRARRRLRFGSLRWRLRWRRRRRSKLDEALDDLPPDVLPDLPAATLVLTADELAAAGRFAEAVRERLRAMVRELIEKQVIPHSPGWTVTELARSAIHVVPVLSDPLLGAGDVFSGIWYGLQPATVDSDRGMRTYATQLTTLLDRTAPNHAATLPGQAGPVDPAGPSDHTAAAIR